ncbi:hypothetical protein M8C21_001369, partial [Ambrosia artemisiifolia]
VQSTRRDQNRNGIRGNQATTTPHQHYARQITYCFHCIHYEGELLAIAGGHKDIKYVAHARPSMERNILEAASAIAS